MRILVAAILAVCGTCALGLRAESAEPNPPRIKFKAEAPLQLPRGMYFGEVAGVDVNSKGHVFVAARGKSAGPAYGASAAQVLEFDANGKFLGEIGQNLYIWSFVYGVRIDKQDNIWIVEKGSSDLTDFLYQSEC